jgi:alanine racemase
LTAIHARLRSAGLHALPRPVWLEIDTEALTGNARIVRRLIPRESRLAAVVKADGYGHGIEVAARAFLAGGADVVCVASLDEAMSLRSAGIAAPVLTLYQVPPDAAADTARNGIEVVVGSIDYADRLIDAWTGSRAAGRGPGLRVHLEVETGLGRAGVPVERALDVARRLTAAPGIELAGLWSHLSEPGDRVFSDEQRDRLATAAASLAHGGIDPPPLHLSSTGGLFAGTGPSLAMVRVGLGLYGELAGELPIAPDAQEAASALRPAMRLVAAPIRLEEVAEGSPIGYGARWRAPRPSVIATLPIGYGDGYPRLLSPGASVLVRGRRMPVVGTIAMDALAVDVTDVPGVGEHDEFVLLGDQGGDRITAEELARLRTTIVWEVVTSMARRIPRVYHAPAGAVGMRTLAGEVLVGD